MQKYVLNKTRKHSERYTLINDGRGMGGYKQALDHYLNNWCIAIGRDNRISGYQGYMAINYFLKQNYIPEEIKRKVRYEHGLNIPESEIWGS